MLANRSRRLASFGGNRAACGILIICPTLALQGADLGKALIWVRPLLLLSVTRKPQQAACYDVALDLRGSARNAGGFRPQVLPLPGDID